MASVRHIIENDVEAKWPVSSAGDANTGSKVRVSYRARLADRWRKLVLSIAPVGYEDEAGFHYGKKPEGD